MLRRNARLRKEYLYRKSLEGAEREEYEKKRLIRQALAGVRVGAARTASMRACGRCWRGARNFQRFERVARLK